MVKGANSFEDLMKNYVRLMTSTDHHSNCILWVPRVQANRATSSSQVPTGLHTCGSCIGVSATVGGDGLLRKRQVEPQHTQNKCQ